MNKSAQIRIDLCCSFKKPPRPQLIYFKILLSVGRFDRPGNVENFINATHGFSQRRGVAQVSENQTGAEFLEESVGFARIPHQTSDRASPF
jgi:hypothetical protein